MEEQIKKHKGMFLELDYGKEIKLDLKNRKIISILGDNCRTSATTIGNLINLSKHSVRYRINQLKEKDIYRGNFTVLNPFVLDFPAYFILIKLKSITPKKEDKIISFFENHPFIVYGAQTQGSYDFNFMMVAKNITHLDKLLKEIRKKLTNSLKEIKILHMTKVNLFNIVPSEFQKESGVQIKKKKADSSFSSLLKRVCANTEEEKIKPSMKEILILKEIAENANLSLQEISEKTKIKPDTVKNTIKSLIKKNIILAFRPKMNVSFLKFHVYVIYFRFYPETSETKRKEFEEYFKNSICTACEVEFSGSYYDAMTFVYAKNPIRFNNLIKDIRNKFSDIIEDYDTDLILTDYKINFFPKGMLGMIKTAIVKIGVKFGR